MSSDRLGFWTRLALRLLPAHVRDEHQREIAQHLRDEPWAEGRVGSLRGWLALLGDTARAAPAAHWDLLRQDLAVIWRGLRRSPGFASAAIAMLGLGVGGTAAVFALLDGVVLRSLPYRDADRLVEVMEDHPERGFRRFGISPANLVDLTADSTLFESSAGFQRRTAAARLADTPERIGLAAVTGGFFRVFTDRPMLGRILGPEDDVPGAAVVVVSHRFWRQVLGGDPGAVGRAIDLDGGLVRIVGVMEPSFQFPDPGVSLWTPLGLDADSWESRGARMLTGAARLRPRVDPARASDAVASRAAALATTYPATNRGWSASVLGQREAIVESVGGPLRLSFAAAMMVLVIALANVVNLLLGRALAREREMAVRTALGARTGRLLRQLATEGLVLATAGSVLGLGLAWLGLRWIAAAAGPSLPRLEEVSIDARVVAFLVVLAAMITVVLSLIPGRHGARLMPWRVLGSGRGGSTVARARWQTGLVVAEVALAVVVLISAGLVVRTVTRLLDRPLGFDPSRSVVFRIEPPWRVALDGSVDTVVARIQADRARVSERYDAFFRRLASATGAQAVGAVSRLPLTGEYWITSVDRADAPAASADQRIAGYVRPMTPGYLAAIGTPILEGRGIDASDVQGAEPVAVIDQTLARAAFGTASPIGEILLLDGPPGRPRVRARVVGVVAAVLMAGLESEVRPTFYVPFAQALEGHSMNWGMDVVVRPATAALVDRAVLEAARAEFPDAPVFGVRDLSDLAGASIAGRRLQLAFLGGFAGVALLLTTIGIGGLLFLVVGQRRRDLAVRLALGAAPRSIWWTVERWALSVAGVGVVIGVLVAVAVAQGLQSLVYQVSVHDPVAMIAGSALAMLAAFGAALAPASRAALTSAVEVLRGDG